MRKGLVACYTSVCSGKPHNNTYDNTNHYDVIDTPFPNLVGNITNTSLFCKKQVYIEKKTSLYLLCDDYVLSIADGTSVSTFLCTPGA